MIIKLFSQSLIFLAVLLVFSCNRVSEEYFVQTVEIPEGYTHEQKVELSARVLPHPRQIKWFEDEFFGFIHYESNTYSGREWGTGFEDATLFNPGDLDTDQWCELMEAAGIRRVIMVVKHHEGYCLWQTRYTDHSVAYSPWRDGQGDVFRELVESCEKYGLRLGVYLSPADLSQDVYYTLDGSEPASASLRYEEPLEMPLGGHIRARAIVGERLGTISESRTGILRTGWTAQDSEGRTEEAMRVLNGNSRSRWISSEAAPGTHSLTIDMKQNYPVSGLTYLPNPAGGFIESYNVEISLDGEKWETIDRGTFGNIRNDPSLRTIFFDGTYEARYIKLSNLRAPGGLVRVGAAEIEVLAEVN